MFSIISDLFRGSSKSQDEQFSPSLRSGTNANRTINYDPNLIRGLEEDHVALVDTYQRIWSEGFENRDFRLLAQLLAQFKSSFQAHLIKENVRFYVYLEQTLADDKHTLQIAKEFRSDMNDIANAVVQFCKRYSHDVFSIEMVQSFKRDYQKIGEALTRRVSLEEKELYILYQPN